MRLTGGLDRGRRLRAPRGSATRPTSAKVREAIFNILGPPPPEAVLDLYAGTGALGIEALSRGSASACFVEREPRALAALHRNMKELGLSERATILGATVRQAIDRLDDTEQRFSWVFMDPPYALGEAQQVLEALSGSSILSSGAVVIVEHDKRHVPPATAGSLHLTDRRYYGDTGVSFYRRNLGLA